MRSYNAKDDILTSIKNKDWNGLSSNYEPEFLIKNLSFKQGMFLAAAMCFNDKMDDDLRGLAIRLLQEIQKNYPKEWASDWKNDAFYGDLCDLTYDYEDEIYKAYKRAAEKVNPIPPGLLLSLASGYLLFTPTISEEEAKKLVQQSLDQQMTIEGVIMMRGLCRENKEQFAYWDKVLEEVEQKNLHSASYWPEFLNDMNFDMFEQTT